jgi:hypothetical protein
MHTGAVLKGIVRMRTMYRCDAMSEAEYLTRSASVQLVELDYDQERSAAGFIRSLANALMREF